MATGPVAVVRTSHQEVVSLVLAAARGSGFPAGNAEDVARAAAWLSLRGHRGIEAALAAVPSGRPLTRSPAAEAGHSWFEGGAVGQHGPALIDLVIAGGGATTVGVRRFDAPLLLFGLCAVAAAGRPLRFVITTAEGGRHEIDGDACRPDPPTSVSALHELAIGCTALGDDADVDSWPTTELEVPDAVWAAAKALAERTYVPSNDRSRRLGAGAGLTDND